jgi:HlyD family secretion protein
MKQIFPKEIIESTIEVHRFKHQVKSKIIYSILLLSIIGIGIALPFIWLDIYSTARGILRPEKERNQLISLYSGKIDSINLVQNQFVKQGDTLLIVNNSIGKERLKLITAQKEDTEKFITDLRYLLNTKKVKLNKLVTLKYQKEQLQYKQTLKDLRTRYYKAKKDFTRQDKLYKKEVIAKVEHENSKYAYDLTINDLSNFKKQQKLRWQAELTQLENSIKEFDSNILQTTEENQNYIITAPITGTIQKLIGLEKGSFLSAGKPIAEISPKTDLIAECYVTPQDIGLINKGNEVKFQIDAFNYNQWGMATGKIIDVNKDVTIIENRPMFRVVCKINEKSLHLKNGFEGNFKKGMTFNARFFIIKRTAFDLLYDKVDDWFVPK